MKKKILFVHQVSVVGGASYCLLNIIKELDRKKFQPVVLLKDDGPLVEELKKLNVKVLFCPSLTIYPYNKSLYRIRILLSISKLYLTISDFEQVVRSCLPDIVYFNNTFLFPYLKITQKLGIKSVIHIREHWPSSQHQKQFRYIQQEILCRADRIIAINEYSARMISPYMTKTTIVYDWIDFSERYENRPFNEIFGEDVSQKKVYLYTGGMQRIKGAYEVLKAFSEKVTSNDCRLLVLGFTKEYSGNGIIGLVKNLLMRLGHPTYEYKVKTIARNDDRIVCIPSTYYIKHLFDQAYCMLSYFTMPHANLAMAEALIDGLPCIAARTEESLEYSQGGKLAILFEMNNWDEFVKVILSVDDNYDDFKERLNTHSSELKKKFSSKENSQRLMFILETL